MLIAQLTAAGVRRVLDGRPGQAYPIHNAFRRTDGDWVVCVADFAHHGTHVPFQPWSLAPEDYTLHQATYDGAGWTYRAASPALLELYDRTRKTDPGYLQGFPETVRPYVDRIYEDGFMDGVQSEEEIRHADGRRD